MNYYFNMLVSQKLDEAKNRTIAWSRKIPVSFPDCGERNEKKQILYTIKIYCHYYGKKKIIKTSRIGRYKKICFDCRLKNVKKHNQKLKNRINKGKVKKKVIHN